jgi:hypothetical protein
VFLTLYFQLLGMSDGQASFLVALFLAGESGALGGRFHVVTSLSVLLGMSGARRQPRGSAASRVSEADASGFAVVARGSSWQPESLLVRLFFSLSR